ncbi:MAG: hypothetical protein ACREDL_20630, partial [Bradyrhizobium sp.]
MSRPELGPADPSVAHLVAIGRRVAPAATGFLYGGYLVLAFAAVILSWKYTPSALVTVAVYLIILSVVVSLAAAALWRSPKLPAQVLLWVILIAVIVIVGLFMSSAFFGAPQNGAVIAAQLLHEDRLAIAANGQKPLVITGTQRLPDWAITQPYGSDAGRFEKIRRLSLLTPVTINGDFRADGQP